MRIAPDPSAFWRSQGRTRKFFRVKVDALKLHQNKRPDLRLATTPLMPGNAICCEEFGHKLQPKSPSANPGKLSSFDFPARSVGIAPSWGLVMRLFAAALATETNTFSPLPTSLASYCDTVFLPPKADPGAEARTHPQRPTSRRREGQPSDLAARREHAVKASLKASLKADLLTATAITKEGR